MSDLSLVPPPVVVNPSADSPYATKNRLWQGIPGIERAPGGSLWAVWYSGGKGEGPYNYVVAVNSGDDGQTWSSPSVVIDPPGEVRAYDPVLWLDPDGKLWLFWAQSRTWYDGRAGVWAITTTDPDSETPTWTTPRRLCNGVMMNKPTVLRNGTWLLPAAVWIQDGEEKHPELIHERFSNVHASNDAGKTVSLLGGADVPDRSYDEHMVVERKDGTLWMLVRRHHGIGESVSSDGGKTWSPGTLSPIAHTSSRLFIRRLLSGRLLLVKHGPIAEKVGRSHLTAYLSDDDGKTWQGGLMLDERANVSYPDGTQAPDGTIYITYDRSRTEEKEILFATFREDDVMAGKPVSPQIRLRQLINKVPVIKEADVRPNDDTATPASPVSAD
ncbi:MAG: exo-alpha-sialidase [Lentisphaeria bacterium]|nr:exo-alpha-sialidase [Lentisphaeria bacterium]